MAGSRCGEGSVIMLGGMAAEERPRYAQFAIRDHGPDHDHGGLPARDGGFWPRRALASGPATGTASYLPQDHLLSIAMMSKITVAAAMEVISAWS